METGLRGDSLRAERAILAAVILNSDSGSSDAADPLHELRALAETAGVLPVGQLIQNRQGMDGRTCLGKGKIQELKTIVSELRAGVVIFDHDLSPSQLRNIEEALCCKVLDRSELILDIFANRATTRAAQLQVEIAQLEYTAPRLRAMWSHLGQVTGGSPMGVGTRGPGEQQLEIDRRLVSRRIVALKRDLAEVQARKTREVQSRRAEHFTVGIVGYTNAGKSTLFNALTAGGAFANDQLFATLQTRTESWNLGGGNTVMLSDTVGFIQRLPHHLVASFRATLEETVHSHLLLLVVDAADENARSQLATVREVLDSIGAKNQPRCVVLNKVDKLRSSAKSLAAWSSDEPAAIALSALTCVGFEALADRVRHELLGELREVTVTIPLRDGRAVDFLEARAQVVSRDYDEESTILSVKLGKRHLEQVVAMGTRCTVNNLPVHEAMAALWPAPARIVQIRTPPHERLVGDGATFE
ncbi:MAG: GTPase HflX [Phycisphaerales bacterium]|nr:GTPase HflX [Phycisphaerales bacterium]